jgi:hypothetical protein
VKNKAYAFALPLSATMENIRKIISNTKLKRRNFYYSQYLWREVRKLSFRRSYVRKNEDGIRNNLLVCEILACIPLEETDVG